MPSNHADDLTEKTSEYSLTKHSIYPKKTTTIVNGVPVDKWVYSILEQGWHEEVPAGTGSVTKVAIPPRVGPISIKIIPGVHCTLVLGFVKDLNPRTLLRGRPLSKLHFMHRFSPVDISVPGEALARGRKALPEEMVAPVVDEGYASITGAEVSVVAWDEWSGKGFWFGERYGEWKAFRL